VSGSKTVPDVLPVPDVLFTEREIARRVEELGSELTRAFAGREVRVVGLMKSCLVFMADLIRHVPLDTTCHFLGSYALRDGGPGPARTDIVYSTEIPYEGQDILLLDDIIDTGITLNFLLDHIHERKPHSVKVCVLIDKPADRKVDVRPDWAAFTLGQPLGGDRFIVGYGLDHLEHYRGVPYLGTIQRPAPPVLGRAISISAGRG
jgi:hypoxanthine phosphoribosyltransferase